MASDRFRPHPALAETEATILGRFRSDSHRDRSLDCPGVLRRAEVGDEPGQTPRTYRAQDVYTILGDYLFMAALSRRLHGTAGIW